MVVTLFIDLYLLSYLIKLYLKGLDLPVPFTARIVFLLLPFFAFLSDYVLELPLGCLKTLSKVFHIVLNSRKLTSILIFLEERHPFSYCRFSMAVSYFCRRQECW
jgi:hypothetical protein